MEKGVLMLSRPWEEYNQELVGLGDPDRATGPVIAEGCGHFIQKDSPEFVAEQVEKLLLKVHNGA